MRVSGGRPSFALLPVRLEDEDLAHLVILPDADLPHPELLRDPQRRRVPRRDRRPDARDASLVERLGGEGPCRLRRVALSLAGRVDCVPEDDDTLTVRSAAEPKGANRLACRSGDDEPGPPAQLPRIRPQPVTHEGERIVHEWRGEQRVREAGARHCLEPSLVTEDQRVERIRRQRPQLEPVSR